jgi:hypothetical protein
MAMISHRPTRAGGAHIRRLLLVSLLLTLACIPGVSATTRPAASPPGLSAADWQAIQAQLPTTATALAGPPAQQDYLKAFNTQQEKYFGMSVAVSGDTVVVGGTGEAYVFVRNGSAWAQQAYLQSSTPTAREAFGIAVAVDGDTIVVGASFAGSGPLETSGAAYVFVRSGTAWTQQAYLQGANTASGDYFGFSVGISGDTIVVGAYGEDSSNPGVNAPPNEVAYNSGAAYVFVRNGAQGAPAWTQQAYLKASQTGQEDTFGMHVAVSGDTVVVGASAEDSSTTGVNSTPNEAIFSAGAAYVFVRNSGIWTQQAYLKASNTGIYDTFGMGVAVDADTIVVGAYGEDSSTTGSNSTPNEDAADAGAAYVFVRNSGIWTQQAYLKASNSGAGDGFGARVAIDGTTIVVGAVWEDSGSTGVNSVPNNSVAEAGAAYVFVRNSGIWTQQAYLKAANTSVEDRFGWSVSVSGTTIAVSAAWEDSSTTGVNTTPNEAAQNAGAAYVFGPTRRALYAPTLHASRP